MALVFRRTMLPLLALLLLAVPAARADEIEQLMERNHWIRARAAVEARLKAAPDDPVAVRQNARVLHAFKDYPGALAQAERAVKLAPNDAQAHFTLAEVVGVMAQRANPLKQLGLAKRFRKEAEAALALDPAHVEARLDLIAFHFMAPGIAGGDKKKAHALAAEAERLTPAQSWRAKARIASETRDSTALAAIYKDAAARNPGDYEACMAYASWLAPSWRGPATECAAHARAALALDPGRVDAYNVLAILQAREGRWSEVDATLAEAAARVPDDLSPAYQAGRIALTEGGDPRRAEAYFRRYLAQPAEATAITHAAARWRLGLALEKQGRRDEALKEIQLANQLDPKFEPAKKDLKRLKG